MNCSVFIGVSGDGFIADRDGGVDWLEEAGASGVDMAGEDDMGFQQFLAGVDCLIMGRKCMEKISSFNLSDEQWPYGDRKIVVLSRTHQVVPENLEGKMTLWNRGIPELLEQLETQGYSSAYIDGGMTIRSFLELGLIDEMTLSYAPLLIGSGVPLFGGLERKVELYNAKVKAYPNDFVQVGYHLRYL